MKKPQNVLADIIAEAIEIATPEAFDGKLAMRRLEEAGLQVRKRVGEIHVTARDMSKAMMLAEASAAGYDIAYDRPSEARGQSIFAALVDQAIKDAEENGTAEEFKDKIRAIIVQPISTLLQETAELQNRKDRKAYYKAVKMIRGGKASIEQVFLTLGNASPDGPDGNVWALWRARQATKADQGIHETPSPLQRLGHEKTLNRIEGYRIGMMQAASQGDLQGADKLEKDMFLVALSAIQCGDLWPSAIATAALDASEKAHLAKTS